MQEGRLLRYCLASNSARYLVSAIANFGLDQLQMDNVPMLIRLGQIPCMLYTEIPLGLL